MLVVLVVLHAYIGVRLLPDLGGGSAAVAAGSALLACSAFLIPRGFRARRAAASRHGARVAWAGLVAMGAFSTLFVLTFLRDVGLAIVLTVAALTPVAVPMATIVYASALAVPVITAT
jgi:hypothetical protein